MTGECLPGSGGLSPIGDLLALTDCRAEALGWGGYHALGHGVWFGSILTAALTIAVALQGYRMLAGRVPDMRHGVTSMARIGLAVALAGSAGAYGTLIFRVATEAPFEISSRLTEGAGLSSGNLPARLDRVYTAIRFDPETRGRIASAGAGGARPAASATDDGQRGAATMFVMVSVGPWLAMRLTTALLLALGPLAALLLLFDATLGLFYNWLRALGGMAIGLAGLAVALPLELEALEPVVASAGTGSPDFTAITAITGVFAILSGAILVAAYRMTGCGMLRRIRSETIAYDAPAAAAGGAIHPAMPLAEPDAWAPATHAAPIAAPAPPARAHAASVTGALAAAARRTGIGTAVTIDAGGLAVRPLGLAPRPAPLAYALQAATADARRGLPQLRLSSDRAARR